jgi:DNA modification methylase
VWEVPNLNPMGGTCAGENAVTGHGTQKPVRLFELPLLHHTLASEAVYDPFCGSGTAIVAAEKLGRACFAMEIDPQYVQVAVTRWEAFTGQKAVRQPVAISARRRAR